MKFITPIIWMSCLLSMTTIFSNFNSEKEELSYKNNYANEDLEITKEFVNEEPVYMLRIGANFVIDKAADLLELVDRAQAKGATTVLLTDSKLTRFGTGAAQGNTWLTETQAFVEGVKSRNMEIIFNTVTMGWCGGVIADAPDFTSGYPIQKQPLRVQGSKLVPVSTSNIANGGFEDYSADTPNVPSLWNWQDAPGERTFIDTQIKRSGNASFRAEAQGGLMSRVNATFPVQPFHQYTLRFWIKAENLTASNLLAIIRDDNNLERNLTNLKMSTTKQDGGRKYFTRPNNLTLDWTEVRIAFNSLSATTVNLGLSLFGGVSGNLWWDDVEVLDTPSLNWLNRDDLPVSLNRADNQTALSFETDAFLPEDLELGLSGFPGKYDTHHSAPEILLRDTSSLLEGDIVEISGYHALPTANGQISCSWNNPEIYDRMRQIHQTLQDTFQPDGFLLNYSEIRTGGWEPLDLVYENSGEALSTSFAQAWADIFEIAPEGNHYFWNDMVDPTHNAVSDYYQINNTLDGSWEGLDSDKVTIINWREGQKITDFGPSSLAHFQDLGFKQVIGAFYDADVLDNFQRWQGASEGISNVIGSQYASWTSPQNFTQIEAFGDLWWTNTTGNSSTDQFFIQNKASGLYLRPFNNNINARIVVAENDESDWFKWTKVVTDEDYFYLKNVQTGQYFRPEAGNDGSLMLQKPTNWNGFWTQWKEQVSPDGVTFHLLNRASNKFIRPTDGEENSNVQLRPSTWIGDWTRWSFEDVDEQNIFGSISTPVEVVTIFPNPAATIFELRASQEIQSIKVYDSQGVERRVKEVGFNGNTIDVSSLRDGIYFVKINFGNDIYKTQRLIVKH